MLRYLPNKVLQKSLTGTVHDFAKGLTVRAAGNAVEPIFLVVGSITDRSDIQEIPKHVEALHVGDRDIYVMGKIT